MRPPVAILDARAELAAGRTAAVASARDQLRAGACVALPTESLYAVAFLPSAEAARTLPPALAAEARRTIAQAHGDAESALSALPVTTPALKRLARRYLPGPLILVAARDGTRSAVRVPGDALCREVIAATGGPLLLADAWAEGRPPATTAREAADAFPALLDLTLDGGRAALAQPGAVVRADLDALEVLRSGILSEHDLLRTARRHVLFVCS